MSETTVARRSLFASQMQSLVDAIEDYIDADTIDLINFVVWEVVQRVGPPRWVNWEFASGAVEFFWGEYLAKLQFTSRCCHHYQSEMEMSVAHLRNWDGKAPLPVIEAVVAEIQANEKR